MKRGGAREASSGVLDAEKTRTLRGSLRHGALIAVWLVGPYATWIAVGQVVPHGGFGFDSHAYWLAARSEHPYLAAPGEQNAYLYSPFFLQIINPLTRLPSREFSLVWMTIEASCLVWLTQSLRWRWRLPLLMLCALEVVLGNIVGLLGVMMVVGMKRPGAWAFALLTKVTPGIVGVIWFAARGEWRSVMRLSAWTAGLVLISWSLSPQLWGEWMQFLTNTSDGESGTVRLTRMVAGAVVVGIGARRGAVWTIPLGVLITMPHFGFTVKDLALLLAIPALLQAKHLDSRAYGAAREPSSAEPRP